MRTRTLSAVVAGAATGTLLLTGVGTATAAPVKSDHHSKASAPATTKAAATPARAAWDGYVYLYYSTASNSAWASFYGPVPDFAGYTFDHGVDGYGQRVKNNVNRAWNNDASWAANIWYNENYTGAVDTLYPGESRQLKVGVRNDNASLNWTYVG